MVSLIASGLFNPLIPGQFSTNAISIRQTGVSFLDDQILFLSRSSSADAGAHGNGCCRERLHRHQNHYLRLPTSVWHILSQEFLCGPASFDTTASRRSHTLSPGQLTAVLKISRETPQMGVIFEGTE